MIDEQSLPATIFHLAEPTHWRAAQESGEYTRSTRGASLDEVGFIHCSFRDQVEQVANFVYADWADELLLLDISTDRIMSEVRVENTDGGTQLFPHIYGPLPTSAVAAAHVVQRGSTGRYELP